LDHATVAIDLAAIELEQQRSQQLELARVALQTVVKKMAVATPQKMAVKKSTSTPAQRATQLSRQPQAFEGPQGTGASGQGSVVLSYK